MDESPTRDAIILAFDKHRAQPKTPFDDSRFLDFLIAKPGEKGCVRNSFRGLRRLNAFLNEIQYDYGVCFSLKDRETVYSLDNFIASIIALQKSPRGSLKSLSNQQQAGAGWRVILYADIILWVIAYGLRQTAWAAAMPVVFALVISVAFFVFARREKYFLRRLRARIEESVKRDIVSQ